VKICIFVSFTTLLDLLGFAIRAQKVYCSLEQVVGQLQFLVLDEFLLRVQCEFLLLVQDEICSRLRYLRGVVQNVFRERYIGDCDV
jgi:hypothetical protein